MAVVAQNFDDGLRAQLDAVGDILNIPMVSNIA